MSIKDHQWYYNIKNLKLVNHLELDPKIQIKYSTQINNNSEESFGNLP